MFVTSHLPTTAFFFCFIITKTKAPQSKKQQNKTNTIIHAQHKVKVLHLRMEGQQKLQC